MKYILDKENKPVRVDDVLVWAQWMEERDRRRVASTKYGDIHVSTVFLGLDYGFNDQGPPVLWETMVFGGPKEEHQERYTTLEDAKAGHERWCQFAVDVLVRAPQVTSEELF